MCDCLNELVKHATENKDIGSWDKLKNEGNEWNVQWTLHLENDS